MNITVLRMREFLYNDLINIKFYTKLYFIEHLINYMDYNLIAKSTKISIQRTSMKPVWGTYILALLLHWGFFFPLLTGILLPNKVWIFLFMPNLQGIQSSEFCITWRIPLRFKCIYMLYDYIPVSKGRVRSYLPYLAKITWFGWILGYWG